ncbi:hypothetical protein J3E74DRAFT_381041 [Bipolaris maydis]|nr:hypothetical protein J3E74DRAFT_381041 [Bipolaris maydis]
MQKQAPQTQTPCIYIFLRWNEKEKDKSHENKRRYYPSGLGCVCKKVQSRGVVDNQIFGAAKVAAWVIGVIVVAVVVVVHTWFREKSIVMRRMRGKPISRRTERVEKDVSLAKGTTACRYDLPYETSRDGVGRRLSRTFTRRAGRHQGSLLNFSKEFV